MPVVPPGRIPVTAPDHDDATLEVRGLASHREDRVLFEGIAFTLDRGEVLQIMGANGSGKTTLLRMVCGLRPPSEGDVLWRGTSVLEDPSRFRGELAYVGHEPGVKLDLTPVENLAVDRCLSGGRPGLDPLGALARTGLSAQAELPTRALSAGQRRRLALARLLVTRAVLWVLDEPYTALDRHGQALAAALVTEHVHDGGSVLCTSHQAIEIGGQRLRRHELDA